MSFTLTLESCGYTIVSEYHPHLTILWIAMEVTCLWPRATSIGAYRESNSISEFKFTLSLNLLGLLDSSCTWESLSSVLDVFGIAVYLPSLRHKNFLRAECKREAEFTSLLSFQYSPAR